MEAIDIDALVEKKLQELKDLLFLRFMRSRELEGFAHALIAAPRLAPAPEPQKESRPARREQIAERAQQRLKPPATGRRERRSHSAEFKLGVLRQLEDGAKITDVQAQHELSYSTIKYWQEAQASGRLKPEALPDALGRVELAPEPSPEEADDEHDLVDAMAGSEAARAEPLPFEQEDSLPIGLARA